jgi:ankyrin repeat protein
MSVWDAARDNDIEQLVSLLQPGGNGNVNEIGGGARSTPLIIASMHDHTDCIHVLLDHGADLNAIDMREGFSALYWLILGHPKNPKGFMEVVHRMLKMGANPFFMDTDGVSLMCLAIDNNMENIVRLLIQYGVNPSASCHTGRSYSRTPLCEAILHSTISMVKVLIELNADLNITTGNTPLIDAIRHWTPSGLENPEDMVRLLLDNGAAIDDNGAGSHLPEWTEESGDRGRYKQRTTVQSLADLAIRIGKPIIAAMLLDETDNRKRKMEFLNGQNVAFRMGGHERVGKESIVNILPTHLVDHITHMVHHMSPFVRTDN